MDFKSMTLKEFQEHCLSTWNSSEEWEKQIFHAALGLGESGELQNKIKKLFFRKGNNLALSKEAIKDEIGDCFYYPLILASLFGISIEEILEHNCNKRESRNERGYYNAQQ